MKRWIKLCTIGALLTVPWLVLTTQANAQGVIAPGAGPINRSMAGASTAAPVDFGASYWNPAAIGFLNQNEVLIGSELLIPSIHYSSRLPARSINGVLPTTDRFGTTRSDSGVPTNLAIGSSFKMDPESPMTFGLGIFGIVGGGTNFAGSRTTPTLGPRQPPDFFGLGPIYANVSLLAIKPMAALRASEKLSVALAPVITTGTVQFSPAFFAPGPRDQFGIPTFPPGTNSRPFWGGGFELGLLYELNDSWNVGFSYKSPIWQERWSYNSSTSDLSARRIGTQAEIPAIFSWGVAYKGIERLLIDVDFRYIDYRNAALWGDSLQSGGLNWSSIFAVAVGGQYQVSDRLTLRAGYLYNQNPINQVQTLFNVQAPGFIQNTMSVGATIRLNENLQFTAGWVHAFRDSIQGPIAQIPGSVARLDAQVDSILAGMTIQYGATRNRVPQPALPDAAAPVEMAAQP